MGAIRMQPGCLQAGCRGWTSPGLLDHTFGGISKFNSGVTSLLDDLLPTEFLGKYDIISRINERAEQDAESFEQKGAARDKKLGGGWDEVGEAAKGATEGAGDKIKQNIVGTNYSEIKPTQDWINLEQVDEYVSRLRAGEKLSPIEVYEVPGKGIYIQDGHHRFIASKLTGIPVEFKVIPGTGPVGLPNWINVLP